MKIYEKRGEVLVAACDSELIGKTLREGELRLHVSSFYDGTEVTEKEFVQRLRMATIGNFVGEATVSAAIDAGFVDKESVLIIEGVPHAQMVLV